jgi:hypothetical protein
VRRHHLAQRALVVTKPRSGARSAGPRRVGRGRTRPGSGACDWGDIGSTRGSNTREREREREREKQEKERVGPGTIPAYVRRADTSANEHKRVSLRGGRDTLCLSATRQT